MFQNNWIASTICSCILRDFLCLQACQFPWVLLEKLKKCVQKWKVWHYYLLKICIWWTGFDRHTIDVVLEQNISIHSKQSRANNWSRQIVQRTVKDSWIWWIIPMNRKISGWHCGREYLIRHGTPGFLINGSWWIGKKNIAHIKSLHDKCQNHF